jgi:hypothetical protein
MITVIMREMELNSLEDNTLNNENNNCDDNNYCFLKSNGYHCNGKVISYKTDYCALTSLDFSKSQLSSIPVEINDLKK